jgi:hypothetical protein
MKRTPLKRKTPLRREGSRGDTKYRRRPRDLEYMKWVRRQPCCARNFATTPCEGRVQADHAGRRGMRQKADDRTCIPLCRRHHRERDNFHGAFKEWGHDRMRQWLDAMIVRHQLIYDAMPRLW